MVHLELCWCCEAPCYKVSWNRKCCLLHAAIYYILVYIHTWCWCCRGISSHLKLCVYVQLTNSSCNTEAGQHERCMASLCITTTLVDISKLSTLGEVYCFMLVCYLGTDKQLSVEEHMLVQQLSFILCGCLVMSTKAYSECCWSWCQYRANFTVLP